MRRVYLEDVTNYKVDQKDEITLSFEKCIRSSNNKRKMSPYMTVLSKKVVRTFYSTQLSVFAVVEIVSIQRLSLYNF